MKRKKNLVAIRIFIENDFTYDDRKKQKEINKWAKEKKEKGLKTKAGQGRILFEGKWFKWEEREKIEVELRSRKEREDSRERREKKREGKEEDPE